jgi:hypothetical protein
MSFPPGTEMFQFPGFALPKLCIHFGNNLVPINSHTGEPVQELIGKVGFPHSEIAGSKVAHTSPALIAACHVLHRLCMPRHPRNTLTSRLRVRTTNDSAGDRFENLTTRPRWRDNADNKSQPLLSNNMSSCLRTRYTATASILRTHSQCQSGEQFPMIALIVTNAKLMSSSLEKLPLPISANARHKQLMVELNGFEPLT